MRTFPRHARASKPEVRTFGGARRRARSRYSDGVTPPGWSFGIGLNFFRDFARSLENPRHHRAGTVYWISMGAIVAGFLVFVGAILHVEGVVSLKSGGGCGRVNFQTVCRD